jgi:hypothetical protein
MSNTSVTAVAPAHPVGVGSSKKGGHVVAFRAQKAFPLDATLELISSTNPWRPNTPGNTFFEKVLRANPKTVQAAVDLGKAISISEPDVQGHLRWLFTWGGSYIKVAGQLYSAPAGAPAQAEPKAPKAPKAEAPKAEVKPVGPKVPAAPKAKEGVLAKVVKAATKKSK